MEALTKDPENSDKGKNNAHHDKADSRKQQLVVKLIFVNRLRRTADTDAADRGQRTIEIAREHFIISIMTPQTELRSLMRRTFRSSIQNAHLHGVVQR